jgi:hypothetical protein
MENLEIDHFPIDQWKSGNRSFPLLTNGKSGNRSFPLFTNGTAGK